MLRRTDTHRNQQKPTDDSDSRHKHTVNAALTTGVTQKRLQKLTRPSHLGGGGAADEGGGVTERNLSL